MGWGRTEHWRRNVGVEKFQRSLNLTLRDGIVHKTNTASIHLEYRYMPLTPGTKFKGTCTRFSNYPARDQFKYALTWFGVLGWGYRGKKKVSVT